MLFRSNVADGKVVGVIPDPTTPVTPTASIQQVGAEILGMDTLSPQDGWTLSSTQLLWTADNGQSWSDRTPGLVAGEGLRAAYFLTPETGWAASPALSAQSGAESWQIYRTGDGGTTWDSSVLEIGSDPSEANSEQVYLHFADNQHGWLVVQQVSSSNFRPGRLFRSADGGQTWQEANIPIGEPVAFLTPQIGFTAGGPAGNELYRTADGGDSWKAQSVAQGLAPGEMPLYHLPQPQGGLNATLPAVIRSENNPRLEVYFTQDGDLSWVLQSSQPLAGDPTLPGGLPPAIESQAVPQAEPGRSLPEGTTQISFSDALHGWALVAVANCTGQKGVEPVTCTTQSQLWVTSDGGLTWTEQTPGVK